MSLDTQVALARPPRGESTHLSRAARQVVPPFLQKLYEIVNDPANEELIRWSDNGDSFYVLNHEKFAREVLGRWFKHQKFASFVRQLNMYGFHKIPHLQQGVLKSDTDTEPWHFEHPNFHRGQPDLLCLIQRKKQPAHGTANDDAATLDEPGHVPAAIAGVTPGQLMDINSIVSGISAIKRHQQAISSDLSTLKQSNDALWKEAVAARQRHAKHQDTINRILKFLAGVFGHTDDVGHSSDGSHSPPQVTPRIRQRLMIGDSRPPKGKHVDIIEVEDDEGDFIRNNRSRKPFTDRYATIETAEPTVASPTIVESITPSGAFSPASEGSPDKTQSPPIRPAEILSRTSSSTSTPRLSTAPASTSLQPSTTTTTVPFGTSNNQNTSDAMWQAAIHHMMQSPAQFQRIMQAFASQQPAYAGLPPDNANGNASALSPYDATQTDYARWFNQPIPPNPNPPATQSLLAATEDPPMQLLLDESDRLQKSYRDANEIDADMDMLQTSIDSLIQNLGIDPNSLARPPDELSTPSLNGTDGATPSSVDYSTPLTPDMYANGVNGLNGLNGTNGLPGTDAAQPDFLLESLLSQIGDGSAPGAPGALGGMDLDYRDVTDNYDHSARIDGTSIEDASTEQLAAFLDEASSVSSEATPGGGSPRVSTTAQGHQKRKSDMVDVPLPTPPEVGTGRKVKRKK